ncbi:hypothetical protein B0H19DRAFT_1275186 [Mycena capillaripes]|nr:hypothetical protein B0H19DRAFT_1275186 [Mycena capillaripes]
MPLLDLFNNVTTALTKAKLIPDICVSSNPWTILSIMLSSGPISLGTEVPPSGTMEPPGIAIAAVPADEDIETGGLVKTETRYTLRCSNPTPQSIAVQPTSSQLGAATSGTETAYFTLPTLVKMKFSNKASSLESCADVAPHIFQLVVMLFVAVAAAVPAEILKREPGSSLELEARKCLSACIAVDCGDRPVTSRDCFGDPCSCGD